MSRPKRPVNLNLFTIHFPLPAITSILHRVSGFFLFLLIPLLLCMLDQSLDSSSTFDALKEFLSGIWMKLIIWAVLAALIYHLVAGIRHLLMDIAIGESLKGGQIGAWLVIIISALLILMLGVWLW